MSQANLIIRIGAEAKEFQQELDKIKKRTEDLDSQLTEVAKVSGIAFGALTAAVGVSVRAFAESEKASKQLTLAIRNQGFDVAKLSKEYGSIAQVLQDQTGIDDDLITSGQAVLQTMIGRTKITKEMTEAALNLGEVNGNVASGFEILGRAINGNTRFLKQHGFVIDENLTKEQRSNEIIRQASILLNGQAASANKGLGSIRGLTTAFENFVEQIGKQFAPIVTKGIEILTSFFKKIEQNEGLIRMIAGLTAAGIAITGIITAVALASKAVVLLTTAFEAMGIASTAALGPLGLVAIALVAIGVAAYKMVAGTKESFNLAGKDADELNNRIGQLNGTITLLENQSKNPALSQWDAGKIRDQIAAAREELAAYTAERDKQASAPKDDTAKKQAELAAKLDAENRDREKREIEARRTQNELLRLEAEGASNETIALAKKEAELSAQIADQKFAASRDALIAHREEIRTLQEEQFINDFDQQVAFEDEILAHNEEYQAMTEEQQNVFRLKNQQSLQSDILTESTARQKAAQDKAKLQIDSNNKYLMDQQKFGTAYAAINQAMNSEIYQGNKRAFGELSQLQTSENASLKAIGKAAAIASITIKTAESAMAIYAGFSTIPIVGQALGIAGAAAAVLFGAENIAKVNSAARGGVLTGGIPGVDSIPVLGMPGELVVPTRNYEEVVTAVADSRNRESGFATGESGGSQMVSVAISMDGIEAEKVLTARQVEARALGTFREAS